MPNQTPITWNDIHTKYPEQRHDMSPERETQFVNDCFTCYENEEFTNTFWTPYEDKKNRIGQSFRVINRCTTKTHDLCTLPMWNIQFEDGTVTTAYPEEIILREMKENGYKPDIAL